MATTQYTRKQIENRIDSQLADNSSQAITAADVRGVLKDYMTSSTYAPVLIYAGIIRDQSFQGSNTQPIVKDLYFNPDFFAKQSPSDPTNTYNIYQLSSISVPGAANGTNTYFPSGGNGTGLVISITVSSNVVTEMEILQAGAGYEEGDVLNLTVGGISLTITYNAAIRHSIVSTFDITTNTDQTYMNHKENNTIISATPLDGNITFRQNYISSVNTIVLDNASGTDVYKQHVQLYRVAGI